MLVLYVLLAFIIVAALVAIETRDLLSALIALGAVGFALTAVFLILQAPDLAIVQIVVEILTLVIMIAVIFRTTRIDTTAKERSPRAVVLLGAGLIILLVTLGWLGAMIFRGLPPFGEPPLRVSEHYFREGLRETGASDLVASIILDYRGYDTLGEAIVLFTAVIGVLAVLRTIGRKKS
jgi:multisubunit Na+/H+ antiporter MnhB subunit